MIDNPRHWLRTGFWLGVLGVASASVSAAPPPTRTSSLVIFGNDACPKGRGGEIVVCARRPEAERYRIPKALRGNPEARPAVSWASRVETLDEIGRETLPGSCSPVGSYGQSGCSAKALRQWQLERRAARR